MNEITESFLHVCKLVGVSIIFLAILGPIYYFIHRHFTSIKCPECGYRKFKKMLEGPHKCKRCGWQNTRKWQKDNPNVKIRGTKWDVSA